MNTMRKNFFPELFLLSDHNCILCSSTLTSGVVQPCAVFQSTLFQRDVSTCTYQERFRVIKTSAV